MAEQSGERNVIGERIRAARSMLKPPVSQEALVARLAVRGIYVDRTAISRIENRARFLRDYEIIAIAKCLKMPVAWFFESTDQQRARVRRNA